MPGLYSKVTQHIKHQKSVINSQEGRQLSTQNDPDIRTQTLSRCYEIKENTHDEWN